MKYKVGEKVRIVSKWTTECNQNPFGYMDKWLGKVMTIRAIKGELYRMKEDIHEGLAGWCWNEATISGLANNHKIVITTEGKETLARLYDGDKVIKKAVARCSPEDTFDFETGARIAFDRLVGEKPSDFEIGERYEYKSGLAEGIIEIVDHHDNWYYWKTIEGMNGWDSKKFQKNSHFARTLKRIEKPKYYNGKVVCVCSKFPNITKGKIYNIVDGVFTYDGGSTSDRKYESFEQLNDSFLSDFIEVVE